MTPSEKRLLRHLAIAVLIKLAVLVLLWWLFVRDAGVQPDAGSMGERISGTISTQGASK